MGQCGCGGFNPVGKFKGPTSWGDKITYTLGLLYPCRDCDGGWAVVVNRFKPDDVEDFCVDEVPNLEFDKYGQAFIPVADLSVIRKKLIEILSTVDIQTEEWDEFMWEAIADELF